MNDFPERAPRKNIFLAASIEFGSSKAEVRIRNMSEGGAMIEGAALPTMDSPLMLKRGNLEMGGTVAWSHGGRCGIRFDGVAHLDEWVAGKRLPARGNALTGQARVDTIQAAIRLGRTVEVSGGVDKPASSPGSSSSAVDLHHRIGDEVAAIQRLLAATVDNLSDDPLMLARHPGQLQALQSASEVLDHLARVLLASDGEATAADITIHALRARLLGKSLF